MAVNQAKIFEQLEQLTHELNRDEFIYGFMAAFNFPKATITQVCQAGGSRNMAKETLKNKLSYQTSLDGEDLDSVFELRLADPAIPSCVRNMVLQ